MSGSLALGPYPVSTSRFTADVWGLQREDPGTFTPVLTLEGSHFAYPLTCQPPHIFCWIRNWICKDELTSQGKVCISHTYIIY